MYATNTYRANVNEIYTGFFINNEQWYDLNAKELIDEYKITLEAEIFNDEKEKAYVMAQKFNEWNTDYKDLEGVWWAGRDPTLVSKLVGLSSTIQENPTDILLKYKLGGYLGVSCKSSVKHVKVPWKNTGIISLCEFLDIPECVDFIQSETQYIIDKYNLPQTAKDRKLYVRANPDINIITKTHGAFIMSGVRDRIYEGFTRLSQTQIRDYVFKYLLNSDSKVPPWVKVQGMGTYGNYNATVHDPYINKTISQFKTQYIDFDKISDKSIGLYTKLDKDCMSVYNKHIALGIKYESEAMCASLKTRVQDW